MSGENIVRREALLSACTSPEENGTKITSLREPLFLYLFICLFVCLFIFIYRRIANRRNRLLLDMRTTKKK